MMYSDVVSAMTVSEARAALHELLERVAAGEEVTLTRHGQPVAVVVRPDVLRARRAQGAFATAAEVADLLAGARRGQLEPRAGLSAQAADQLVAAVRCGRERS
jgi:antitoxin (DNA-binding transcriptional repressor) of toxin-antitoxin stability system